MAAKQVAKSSSCGPNLGPTEDDIKEVKSQFDDDFRNLPDEQWREIAAALPPDGKGRDHFFRVILIEANDYWLAISTIPPTRQAKFQYADRLLKDARADLKKDRRLAPERAEALWVMAYYEMEFPGAYFEGAKIPGERFLRGALDLWLLCGGEPKFSRDKDSGTPTGPLIRYLALVCKLVMGTDTYTLHTLADFVVRFRN
jgi:hypothetical protein